MRQSVSLSGFESLRGVPGVARRVADLPTDCGPIAASFPQSAVALGPAAARSLRRQLSIWLVRRVHIKGCRGAHEDQPPHGNLISCSASRMTFKTDSWRRRVRRCSPGSSPGVRGFTTVWNRGGVPFTHRNPTNQWMNMECFNNLLRAALTAATGASWAGCYCWASF